MATHEENQNFLRDVNLEIDQMFLDDLIKEEEEQVAKESQNE